MPLIGNVGRRSLRVRVLNTSIHLVLLLGAVTMVYPFLIMLAGSVKSAVDSRSLTAIPEYFHDDAMLYRKWVEAKYNETIQVHAHCHRERIYSFEAVLPPARTVTRRVEDWNAFLEAAGPGLNDFHRSLGHVYGRGVKPELLRDFVHTLKAEPDVQGDIARLNAKYGTAFVGWDAVAIPMLMLLQRDRTGSFSPIVQRMVAFGDAQPIGCHNYFSLDSFFVEQALRPKYPQGVRQMNEALGTGFASWAEVVLARRAPDGPLREHWTFFVKNRLNLQFIAVSEDARPAYQSSLAAKYKSIGVLNERYGSNYADFSEVPLLHDVPRAGAALADWDHFVTTLADPEHLAIHSTETLYRDFLREKYASIEALVAAHELGFQRLEDLPLSEQMPRDNIAHADDWLAFAQSMVDAGLTRPDYAARRSWVAFLTAPYRDGVTIDQAALNGALGLNVADAEGIALPVERPAHPELAARWEAFLREVCPPELLRVDAARGADEWLAFLRGKYPGADDLNRHYGLKPESFDAVAMPTADADYATFQQVRRPAFREFLVRNYAAVFEMMFYNGRAIVNTLTYCALAVLTALIVNPLAAYALSRYRPPSQYKLLLLLMLTMAFPPMVLGIPNFLLLRKLGLLNTFAALVLPGMANGYMIFLLKGFFDSLPRELYESAQIDGASEWTMFWQITMATSTPILAVIALQAFTLAYGNFMMAFIVCQNPKMWTMMVHIYQLQQRSSQGVSFAALVIAAIPTLLVFIFCQNIIMRGIVVPTEK